MNNMRSRAKSQMPMVLLTLLSIIQALALELLWVHVTESPDLMRWSWFTLLHWIQIIVTLLGIILVWLLYSSMTMRFSWVPASGDSVIPFGIGILEFTLIAVLGVAHLGAWFATLAGLFAVSHWAMQSILRRARSDGDNDHYFSDIPPARFRDFLPALLVVATLLLMGLALKLTGHTGVFALAAVLLAGVAVAQQIHLCAQRWRKAMRH